MVVDSRRRLRPRVEDGLTTTPVVLNSGVEEGITCRETLREYVDHWSPDSRGRSHYNLRRRVNHRSGRFMYARPTIAVPVVRGVAASCYCHHHDGGQNDHEFVHVFVPFYSFEYGDDI